MINLLQKISKANPAQLDGSWAILKSDLGILRKVAAICQLFSLDISEILDKLPRDDENRILDRKTREIIHEKLLEKSKQKYEKINFN